MTVFCSVAAAQQAGEDVTEQAKKHFNAGESFYRQSLYKEAIVEFQKAYQLVPHGVLLFNIAQCYEKDGDVPAALRAYKEYLRAVPNADDKDYVQTSIINLEKRLKEKGIQQVRVYSTPPGAQVAINGASKGITPFSIEVVPGKYIITLTKKGFRPVDKEFQMTGESSLELDFSLNEVKLAEPVPVPAPAPVAENQKPAEKPVSKPPEKKSFWQQKRIATWVFGGTGLATLITAVPLGVIAEQTSNDLHVNDPNRTQKQATDMADKAQTYALAANICYGVAGGLLATGLVLLFVEPGLYKQSAALDQVKNMGLAMDRKTGSILLTYGAEF
jgi:tetratricopeptide (TPR) repeat protein